MDKKDLFDYGSVLVAVFATMFAFLAAYMGWV